MNFFAKILTQFLDRKTLSQAWRFLAVGGVSTLISFSVFSFSIRIFDLHYLVANLIAFGLSIIFNYNCNKRWSFGGEHQKPSHVAEYLAVYFSSLALGSLILKVAIDYLKIFPEGAFFISLCFTTLFNFFCLKFFVFKK
jgi:putative flippase GtrA